MTPPLTGGTITTSGTIGLGTPAAGQVLASTGGAPAFTASPILGGLQVVNASTAEILASAHNSVAQFIGQRAGGSPGAPTAVASGDQLSWFGARGYTGTGGYSGSRAAMIMRATQGWTSSANGADVAFETTSNFTTSRLERMRITHDGKVGIGTASPDSELEIVSPGIARIYAVAHGNSGVFLGGYAVGGSPAAPTATEQGRLLLGLVGSGHNGSSRTLGRAVILMTTSEQWSSTNNGADISFYTTSNASDTPAERMRISHDGNVGIGTSTVTRAKVEINGGFGSAPLVGAYAALFSNGVGTNSNGTAVTPSLWASNVLVSPGYYAFSDARIKRVVGPSDARADLSTLLLIHE